MPIRRKRRADSQLRTVLYESEEDIFPQQSIAAEYLYAGNAFGVKSVNDFSPSVPIQLTLPVTIVATPDVTTCALARASVRQKDQGIPWRATPCADVIANRTFQS